MRLKDKIAIVTGAGSGFGEGIAKRFAQEGCNVCRQRHQCRRRRARRETRSSCRRQGAPSSRPTWPRDADWAAMLKFTLDTFGGLTHVVNNAGTTHRNQPMLECQRRAVRPHLRGERQEHLPQRHALRALLPPEGRRRVHHHRVHGRRPAAAGADLVQRQQGRGDHDRPLDGGGARARPHPVCTSSIRWPERPPLLSEFMGGQDTPEIRAKFIATIPLGRLSGRSISPTPRSTWPRTRRSSSPACAWRSTAGAASRSRAEPQRR